MQSYERLGDVTIYPRSKYVHELRSEMTPAMFAPSRARLALVPLYVALIAVAAVAIARHWVPWPVVPAISLGIGCCFALLTFVGHEALHGGMTANKRIQHLVGLVTFMPFLISPRLWSAWHNETHHANTNLAHDPDAYPTLDEYRASATKRFAVDAFSLGGRRWRGGLSMILGFTVQSANQLRSGPYLSRSERRAAAAETALGVAVWLTVAFLVGFVPFLFVYVLPLLVANVCVMAFILTNHSLSPRLEINDPLVGGLTVTTSRFIQWITLGFGFHVEHHLFPAMSSRHAPALRELVLEHWPERYQSMSLGHALSQLHRTARVYKDATTLYDPMTGAEFPTLMPTAR
ncbi:MAG TPA: fatty acid desaturase [Kofleriaceae bacterium]|nr:fatty acid desaturase [Kofleriaceae bacterium]